MARAGENVVRPNDEQLPHHSVEHRVIEANAVHEFRRRRLEARRGPGVGRDRSQRAKGKLLVRERIDLLVDPGSFSEIGSMRQHQSHRLGLAESRPLSDGVICGWGRISGRDVCVIAQDFRSFGGSVGEANASKVCQILAMAGRVGAPVVMLNDSAGARVQEGALALDGYGRIFKALVELSGVVPLLSVMLGPCAGGASYAPALTDFVFTVEGASMFLTGPEVVSAVTGEAVDAERLGGAAVHREISGVSHLSYQDEESCLLDVRYLLSILPSNNRSRAPEFPETRTPADRKDPGSVVPRRRSLPYDVREVIAAIVDDGGDGFFEIRASWGRSLTCGLAHLDGMCVGIVASQPMHLAGALDIDASQKGASFVQFCDSFNLPLVTLVDVPGFMPGSQQESGGIIRHGAKLLHAYCRATVPRVCLVMRKAYGGAYIVMDSRGIGADLVYAWPGTELAVLGDEAAADLVFRRAIADSDDPRSARADRARQYRGEVMHQFYGVETGLVDEIIEPCETREVLVTALRLLREKRQEFGVRKHSNLPL